MSKLTQKAIGNSLLMVANAFLSQGLNFILLFAYARYLSSDAFGALVTSQAKVLVWMLLVDLGMYSGLISVINASKKEITDPYELTTGIVSRLCIIRIIGASIGIFFIAALSIHDSMQSGIWDHDLFLRNMAFTPYLIGYALHQTIAPYFSYLGKQTFSIIANAIGLLLFSFISLFLVMKGASVSAILFSQSLSGFLSFSILFLRFLFWNKKNILERKNIFEWRRKDLWQKLFLHSWPYAIVFAASVLWQRLDQIAAARLFGLSMAGEYALSVKIVAIPVLMISAISLALFPDLQRIGTDAPEKLNFYMSAILKLLLRYGILLSAISVVGAGFVLSLLFPKFLAAKELLFWFIPGVWTYWMYNFSYNALFALHRYKGNVLAHLIATLLYISSLFILPKFFGIKGLALSYNTFCIILFIYTYFELRKAKGIQNIFLKFSEEEKKFLLHSFFRIYKKN